MSKVIGLDVGSFSIKVVVLSKKGKGYKLEAIGICLNPLGLLPGEDEASQVKVAEAVKKLLADNKLSGSRAVVALPESKVYTRVVDMPLLSDSELASAIQYEAEQYIPIPVDQVNIDYEVISRPESHSKEQKMQVFLVAAPKNLIEREIAFCMKCGVEVIGLETEMLASARALITEPLEADTNLIVHLGASSSSIAVISRGMPVLIHSIDVGGNSLSRSLSLELSLDQVQAEEYKRSYGLDMNQLEGKVAANLKPLIDRLMSEVRKAMQYYNNSARNNQINRVILSGGTSLLPGFVAYAAQLLEVEVVLGNAFAGIEAGKDVVIPNDTVSFSTAVGLAMREL